MTKARKPASNTSYTECRHQHACHARAALRGVWGQGFLELFPRWNAASLELVFSVGVFGTYCAPLGGYLYDRFGARAPELAAAPTTSLGPVVSQAEVGVQPPAAAVWTEEVDVL